MCSGNNNEIELILLLSNPILNEDDIKRLKNKIHSANSFPIILGYLIKHKTVGIALNNLINYELIFKIDKSSRDAMNSIVSYNTLKYEQYCEQLENITNILNSKKLKYAVIKGINLVNKIYGFAKGFILRTFNDIDLLVDKEDIGIVVDTLKSLGYYQGYYSICNKEFLFAKREKIIHWSLNSHQEYPFVKKAPTFDISPLNVFTVDINHTFFEGGKYTDKLKTKSILNCCKLENLNNIKYWGLSKEIELLQIMCHLYKDITSTFKIVKNDDFSLINVIDIYLFILTFISEIDWNHFKFLIYDLNIYENISKIFYIVYIFSDKNLIIYDIIKTLFSEDVICKITCEMEKYFFDNIL